jgi:hypothetical protein
VFELEGEVTKGLVTAARSEKRKLAAPMYARGAVYWPNSGYIGQTSFLLAKFEIYCPKPTFIVQTTKKGEKRDEFSTIRRT